MHQTVTNWYYMNKLTANVYSYLYIFVQYIENTTYNKLINHRYVGQMPVRNNYPEIVTELTESLDKIITSLCFPKSLHCS